MDEHLFDEMAAVEDVHWWFVARRRILARILDALALPPGSAILEAGCGSGGNLSLLAQYGTLYAFEPDAQARRRADARGIVAVAEGALPDAVPFPETRFDLIALLDVLEHIDDDRATLEHLRRRLKPGGRLLATVPAYTFLWSRHDVANHHRRRYDRRGLIDLAKNAGLDATYATYFNTLLFPLILAARLFGNLTGQDEGSDVAMPARPVNTLLAHLFASERFVLPARSLPFGVSLLMVAQPDPDRHA